MISNNRRSFLKFYKSKEGRGEIFGDAAADFTEKGRTNLAFGFQSDQADEESIDLLRQKIEYILESNLKTIKGDVMTNIENGKVEVGAAFWRAIERGPDEKIREIVQAGFNANFPHPKHGLTPISRLAGNGTKQAIDALLSSDQEIDFLTKDRQGLLPSQAAKAGNRDKSVWRFLEEKEKEQAIKYGVDWDELSQPNSP